MLQAMRQNMKVILWITVAAFIALIVLVWGADLQLGNQGAPPPNSLGTVNGEPISAADYQQYLAATRQNAQAMGQDLLPNDELQLEEQVWNTLVTQSLLRQAAQKRGLEARDAEIRSVLLNNPPDIITQNPQFQNEQGQFDLATYRAIIQDPQLPEASLIQLENYVRANLPVQKLESLIFTAAKVTEEELREDWLTQNERARITYTLVDAAGMEIPQEVSEADIETQYGSNPETYRLPARTDVLYIDLPRVATPEDSATLIADLEEFADDAREAEEARARGEESLQYSDFATLAQTFSDAPSAEDGGLSSGYLTPAEMSPAIAEAVAGLSVGEISAPFRDGAFYHILKLEDEMPNDAGERTVQIRVLSRRIAPSDSTLNATSELLQEVQDDARRRGLRQAAEAVGLTVEVAENVRPQGITPGLAAIPQVGAWAHMNPEGTVSRIYETNTRWFLLQVGAKKEAGVALLEEVRSRVERDVLSERRFAEARTIIDRVTGQIKLGETLEAAAAAESLDVVTSADFTRQSGIAGLGRDYEVMGAAFTLPVGSVSEPVKSLRGWVILRVEDRPEVDWTAFEAQKADQMRRLRTQKENRVYTEFLETMRDEAEVVDYRI